MVKRSLRRSFTFGIAILFPLMLGMAGCFLSTHLADYVLAGGLTTWKSLNFTPGKATRIVSASIYGQDAIVSADNGQNYHYQIKTLVDENNVSRDTIVWERTDIKEFSPGYAPNCNFDVSFIPSPPGQILDTLDIDDCFEIGAFNRYVILTDGSVWLWERPNPIGEYLILGLGGIVVGIAIGIVISIRIIKYRRSSNRD